MEAGQRWQLLGWEEAIAGAPRLALRHGSRRTEVGQPDISYIRGTTWRTEAESCGVWRSNPIEVRTAQADRRAAPVLMGLIVGNEGAAAARQGNNAYLQTPMQPTQPPPGTGSQTTRVLCK
jgi:hypothetical protein